MATLLQNIQTVMLELGLPVPTAVATSQVPQRQERRCRGRMRPDWPGA